MDYAEIGKLAKTKHKEDYSGYSDEEVGRAYAEEYGLVSLTQANIEKINSTQIELDARAAQSRIDTDHYLERAREETYLEIRRTEAQGYQNRQTLEAENRATLQRMNTEHNLATDRLTTAHKLETNRIQVELQAHKERSRHDADVRQDEADRAAKREHKQAKRAVELEQYKAACEQEREHEHEDWDTQRQIEYANRVHIFPLNYKAQELREMYNKTLDEIDELKANKTNTPSLEKKIQAAEEHLTTIKVQLDGTQTQLREGANGEG